MEYMESKMQDHYEASNAWLEEFKQLKAERDALAVQVALIHDAWQSAGLSVKCNDITEVRKAITSTPKQCLAEIKAEAVEAAANKLRFALVDGGNRWAIRHSDALEYADKIRNGETK